MITKVRVDFDVESLVFFLSTEFRSKQHCKVLFSPMKIVLIKDGEVATYSGRQKWRRTDALFAANNCIEIETSSHRVAVRQRPDRGTNRHGTVESYRDESK